MTAGPAGAFAFEAAIAVRAQRAGIDLAQDAASALAGHARWVLERNALLHLTTITQPDEFVERHLGEAFEGAALLPPAISGLLLDLGSGNGYPGIPLARARPGLVPVLAESNRRRAAFLREALEIAGVPRGVVLERSVQRADDLAELEPFSVLATRAAGGWERIIPKLLPRLAPGGAVLIWSGSSLDGILRRRAWSRLRPEAERVLPERANSRVTRLSL